MASVSKRGRRSGKKGLLLNKLNEWRPKSIDEARFRMLQQMFAPISEGWARRVLRESGIPLAPMVEGVRQDSLEALDRTLLNLLGEYEAARQAADRERARSVRRLVILAKDHARLSARAAEGRRKRDKEEMVLRMLTWLENPGIFRQWIQLRNAVFRPDREPEA